MREASVVTCFLLRRGDGGDELLLLRRSDRVSTYRGLWAGVSGYLETDSPLEQAYRELEEEVGLSRDDVRLVAEGEPLVLPDASIGVRWTVYPFLFEALRPERVRLDWEHTESRWLRPAELASLETVPGLAEGFARLYGR
jgi:8-oxo-dGTP pyrophosphatase MutT (NUDIX family)